MTGPQKWIGRLALLGIGLGIGGVVISRFEAQYRVHETEIATRPVFDPPGLKYAQVIAPERSAIRGWVVGMAPPAPSPERKRVLAVGDSLTWGLGVEVNQAWPAELQRALSGVDVHNLGMCGYDAEQGISLITHHLADWGPDLVIWANYTNDVDPTFLMFGAHDEHPVFVGSNIPEPARVGPEWLSLWLVQNSAMFRSIQAAKLARVLSSGHTPTAPEGWYEGQVTALRAWADATGIPVLVLTLPDHTQADPDRCTEFIAEKDCKDQQESYARIIETVGRSGLPWVDGQRIYAASGQPHFMGADRDTGHPTPEGHRVLAQGLVTVVQNTLAQTN